MFYSSSIFSRILPKGHVHHAARQDNAEILEILFHWRFFIAHAPNSETVLLPGCDRSNQYPAILQAARSVQDSQQISRNHDSQEDRQNSVLHQAVPTLSRDLLCRAHLFANLPGNRDSGDQHQQPQLA